MPVTEVPDSGTFARYVATKGKLVVVDFYATWCGPCKAIAPIVEQLSSKYSKEALFLKVDVDKLPDVSQGAGVQAMPSFGFYGDGRLVELQRGGDPRALEEKIKKYGAQFYKTAFSGSGYTLGGPGSGSSSSAASAAPKPAPAAAAPAAAASGGSAAAAPARRNPWADPNFMPGKKPSAAGGVAGSTSSASAFSSAASSGPSSATPTVASTKPSPASTSVTAAAPTAAPSTASSSSAASTSAAAASAPSPPPSADSASTPASSTSLPVNAALLSQMLDMGFTRVRAEKALLLTHNVDTDSAVGWLVEHQDDADIDEPLQVVGTAPAGRPTPAGVDVEELDEDERVLYEELMRKKAKDAAPTAASSTASSAASTASASAASSGAKKVQDMSSEEKMQWLADKKAAVKAKKEAEALEKVKSDYKSSKGMTSALNELKEQREEHERQQAMAAKKKEAADKERQRREIAAKLQAAKDARKKEQERTMAALQKSREEKAQAAPGK